MNNELGITSDCTCPGLNVTYECRVMGTDVGITVWRGSAFDCVGNDIILYHSRFSLAEGAMGQCNEGSILGTSLRLEAGSFYVSQLRVRVSPEVTGKSIECLLDDINATFIGKVTVNVTTGF